VWACDTTQWPLYPRERYLVSIVQEAGKALGLVLMGMENIASVGEFEPWTIQPVVSCYTDNAILISI